MQNSKTPPVVLAVAVSRDRLLGYLDDNLQGQLADTTNEAQFVYNDPGAIGDSVSVTPLSLIGHGELVAAGAIVANRYIYQAAGGKVDDVAGDFQIGLSTEAAAATGDTLTAFVKPIWNPSTWARNA